MGFNKFTRKDGTILCDLTTDTITADKLAKGYTAHDKSGNVIVGTYEDIPEWDGDYTITGDPESGGGGNTGGGGSSDPTKFVSVDDFVLHNFGEYAANRNVEITMRTSYSNPAQTKTISVSGGELNRTHYMLGMTALYNARAADNLAYCQTIAPSGATVARTSAGFQGKAEIIFNILGFDGTNYNAEVWCIYRSSTTPTLVKGAKATYEDGWFVINIPDVIDDGGVTITYADGTTEKPVDYNAFYTAFKIVDKGSV